MTTTREYELDVGQRLVKLDRGGRVAAVSIYGLRRPVKLVPIESGFEGQNREMRGLPAAYTVTGRELHIWPTPAHRWTLIVDTMEEEENVAG